MKMLNDYKTNNIIKETNFEHYKDELLRLTTKEFVDAIAIIDGVPKDCDYSDCEKCALKLANNCIDGLIEWGFQEYKEPLKLSLAEHHFFAAIGTGYVVRDNHGQLYWCETPPSKVNGYWEVQSGDMVRLNFLKFMELPFIKYDGDVCSVESLLELEVKE